MIFLLYLPIQVVSITGAFIGGLILPKFCFQKIVHIALFGFRIHGKTTQESKDRFREFYKMNPWELPYLIIQRFTIMRF